MKNEPEAKELGLVYYLREGYNSPKFFREHENI